MMKGKDGITSVRKVLGSFAILAGIGLEGVAQVMGIKSYWDLAPGGLCFLIGSLLWGFVTFQNLKSVIKK